MLREIDFTPICKIPYTLENPGFLTLAADDIQARLDRGTSDGCAFEKCPPWSQLNLLATHKFASLSQSREQQFSLTID
jgi:hypothetical protein